MAWNAVSQLLLGLVRHEAQVAYVVLPYGGYLTIQFDYMGLDSSIIENIIIIDLIQLLHNFNYGDFYSYFLSKFDFDFIWSCTCKCMAYQLIQ